MTSELLSLTISTSPVDYGHSCTTNIFSHYQTPTHSTDKLGCRCQSYVGSTFNTAMIFPLSGINFCVDVNERTGKSVSEFMTKKL